MNPRTVVMAAAGVAATLAPAALASTPAQRSFSDWTVTCDNGLRCVALAGQDDDGRVLMIERDAGPDGATWIEIAGDGMDLVDGSRVTYPAPAWRHDKGDGFSARSTGDVGAIQHFIDAIRNGSRLHSRDDDAEEAGISLRGLSAALLFIDEAQGRLGTRGALLRRGDKPDATVPAAPPLPALRAAPGPTALGEADATRLAAAVRRTQADTLAKAECDDGSASADQAWPLTDTEALVHLGCWMGAYQGSGLLFRVPRAQPAKAVRLLLPTLPGAKPHDMLTSADYDPAHGRLHHYGKGRGLGDCGETASWVFDGRAFVLAEWTSMDRCTGVQADHWPTLWRSRNAATQDRP